MATNATAVAAPSALLSTCLRQFDDLREQGRLFYEESTSTYKQLDNFPVRFQFTLVKAFAKKPWAGKQIDNPTHREDPFGDPEVEMIVPSTGIEGFDVQGYVLQLNKYCAVRPQLLLHPKTFQPQTDRLSQDDFKALVPVLKALGPETMAFYNCGPESGSSQPYKHIQIMMKPSQKEFVFWPDDPLNLITTPYLSLRGGGYSQYEKPSGLCEMYQQLLSAATAALNQNIEAHNFIMTKDWMIIIPRRRCCVPNHHLPAIGSLCGAQGVNSMGMMGMLWLNDEREKEWWNKLEKGPAWYLEQLAYPREKLDNIVAPDWEVRADPLEVPTISEQERTTVKEDDEVKVEARETTDAAS